jgi:uncharacterized protein
MTDGRPMTDETHGYLEASERSTLRRLRDRGSHDRAMVDAILDEGLVCHVGFTTRGSTFVIPTIYARVADSLYLHGAAASRMLRSLASGTQACVTVTLVDGLVFARSAFHHSMNYRSVVLFGEACPVEDPEEKRAAVLAIVDHMAPGRSIDARPPTPSELRATLVLRVPIEEGSAKIRVGGPIDDPDDLGLEIWAGQLPFDVVTKPPVPDEGIPDGVDVPSYVASYPPRRHSAP